jgi:HAD superfamily hydrolase (TIGR01662 family)
MAQTEIYMMVGVPASGKSRAAQLEIAPKHGEHLVYLSRDREGGKVADLIPKMQAAIAQEARAIVLDCTFVQREDRAPFVAAATAAGGQVHCWFFDTPPELAQWNACWRMCERHGRVLRQHELKDAKNDPNVFLPPALFGMAKKLEKPTAAEGFSSVRVIKPERWTLPAEFKNKAIILDYDGTVRDTKSGDKYPRDPKDVVAFPQAAKKLKAMQADGWKILGASNQSGVAKNDPPMAVARACFDETNRQLGITAEVDFDYSPAGPVSSWHRKPLPGLGVDAVWKHRLDPSLCIMVGDMTSDKTFASRCGFKFEWAKDFFKL